MNYERPALLDRLAGAYVLGTMPARARRRFAQLHGRSSVVQRAVAHWHNRLDPLFHAIAPVAPPPAVWWRIAARLNHRVAASTPVRPGWIARLRRWRAPALGFAFGAVVTMGFVSGNAHLFGMHHMSASLSASYVGILSDRAGTPVLTVGSHRHGETMTIRLRMPLVIPPGHVARLWALPANGLPVAIANVPANGMRMVGLPAPAEQVFATVSRLAVSFEADPETALPGAPFVLAGPCVKLW
jgi:anti-sigma-K factor RskA